MMEFRHPKYYKELRKLRNKLDQAISDSSCATAQCDSVRLVRAQSGKLQATSSKLQATSRKLQATSRSKLQAASFKHLVKLQATSVQYGSNRQAPSKAFRDDRLGDRGSRSSRKVLRVQERRLGL